MLTRSGSIAPGLRTQTWQIGTPAQTLTTLDRVLVTVKRQYKLLLAVVLAVLALGYAYLRVAEPLYTANSYLLIDTRRVAGLEDSSVDVKDTVDDSTVDSQVEVIMAEANLLKAMDKLHLTSDPLFNADRPGFFGRIAAALGRKPVADAGPPGQTPEAKAFLHTREVLAQVQQRANVRRIGRTYVLNIAFTSPDAQRAADVANAIADQYLTDQLESKYDSTQRASSWLQERIQELRERSIAADTAVQKFKADHNLISAGGMLVNEQQLSELNTELVKIRSDTAQAEARYRRIKSIVDTGAMDAAVTESIDSPVIVEMRNKYLDASRRRDEVVRRLGPTHEAAQSLTRQMEGYQKLIFEELGRIAESYRSDFEIARNKEASLETSLNGMMGVSAQSNETQVQLRELERESETYKNIYTTFLQRYQQALQQQSFPITEARIITRAVAPQDASAPNVNLVMSGAALLGLMLGGGLSGLREYHDRVFRAGSQVREELGREFLGMIWSVSSKRLRVSREPDPPGARQLRLASQAYRYVLDNPSSPNAETLRSVKVAADLVLHGQDARVVGVVSVLPGEGKTTVSKNLASLIAASDVRTLLIDCDLRNPGLTRAVASHATEGLVEAITANRPAGELLYVEPETGLHVLPCVVRQQVFHSSELLGSRAMAGILDWARSRYDYVVLDLPPLAPVIDVKVLEGQIDAFAFVVEWGQTPRRIVRSVLASNEALADKCLGVVLNKADPRRAQLYQAQEDSERYLGKYTNYYLNEA